MSEVTETLASATPRRIHIRRASLRCEAGPDAGRSWRVSGDVVQIGTLAEGDVVLADPTVSRRHAEIARTREGILLRDLGSTNGTFVGPVRVREVFLGPGTRFRVGHSELLFETADEIIDVSPSTTDQYAGLYGESAAMREVLGLLERLAPTELSVLVTGETGTGKELVCRALHAGSPRARGPLVVFDCGAVPENLVESELFGHERGAFTGAERARPGLFEQAQGGTLFLDEVGELPLELQPKLLRALESREVRRLGGGRSQRVDVRVVAATHRDLRRQVDEGRFRADLFYRLAVVELTLPPLRDRLGDLPGLCRFLLARAPGNPGVREPSPEVLDIFRAWRWPGNVRELNNVLTRALPFCDGPRIPLSALPPALRAAAPSPAPAAPLSLPPATAEQTFKEAKDQLILAFERQYLADLIERHQGNVSRAARSADIDRKSLTRLLKKHGLGRGGEG